MDTSKGGSTNSNTSAAFSNTKDTFEQSKITRITKVQEGKSEGKGEQ